MVQGTYHAFFSVIITHALLNLKCIIAQKIHCMISRPEEDVQNNASAHSSPRPGGSPLLFLLPLHTVLSPAFCLLWTP